MARRTSGNSHIILRQRREKASCYFYRRRIPERRCPGMVWRTSAETDEPHFRKHGPQRRMLCSSKVTASARCAGLSANNEHCIAQSMLCPVLQKRSDTYIVCMKSSERVKEIYLAAAIRNARKLCITIADGDARCLEGSRSTRYRTKQRIRKWQEK